MTERKKCETPGCNNECQDKKGVLGDTCRACCIATFQGKWSNPRQYREVHGND